MTLSAQAIASYEKELAHRETFYGGSIAVAALRCFRRYDRNATVDIEDQYGRLRWMGQKQARVYGIVHRLSVSGSRMTMTAIAKEAQCAPSTVSRSILKFQTWRMFAIDVTRGRHGGISVRLRHLGDELESYAKAAWERIRAAANRARINVASLINLRSEGYVEPDYETATEVSTQLLVSMDAKFMEAWDAAERDGARILADQKRAEASFAPPGDPSAGHRGVDPEWFASAVIAERRRLAIIDPEGEKDAVAPLW